MLASDKRTKPVSSSKVLILAAGLLAAGCQNAVPADKFQTVQRELQAAAERNRQLETTLAAQQSTIRNLRAQIAAIRDVGGDPAEVLIVPERIELASLSGPYDDDSHAGDDGIVLYIQTIDRDQHVVKAAGTLSVKLLDPANPSDRIEFATYQFDLAHTRKLWYGRLMTNHFTVRCPWPQGHAPLHDEIVAHVVFTEIITGKSLTATATFKVNAN